MSDYTLEQLIKAGYDVEAAPEDDWRTYDEAHPVPNYYDFDWLSSRHPDLYHKFALSSLGLVDELNSLMDLTGLEMIDIGAGTGRITLGVAKKAKKVLALDPFIATMFYGRRVIHQAGLDNVRYIRGDSAHLPLPDHSMDAAVCAWAIIHYPEAYRILKPDGYLIDLLPAPGALCGELTPVLAECYPQIITEIAPASELDASAPVSDTALRADTWNGVPVHSPIPIHDFTYTADYHDHQEAAAIVGRLFGPIAKRYMLDRKQSTLSWRLRIVINRVRK